MHEMVQKRSPSSKGNLWIGNVWRANAVYLAALSVSLPSEAEHSEKLTLTFIPVFDILCQHNVVFVSIRQELLNGTTQIGREKSPDFETQICTQHGMEIEDAYSDQAGALTNRKRKSTC